MSTAVPGQAGAGTPIVAVQDLKLHFRTSSGHDTIKAVDGVDFDVMPGETFGVIGESGSGKTTLGRALVCLLKPTSGQLMHAGRDPHVLPSREFKRHRRDFQIIFQDPSAALDPRMTVLRSVRQPLDIVRGLDAAERDRRALEAIDRVGLRAEFAERYPHELSGGQKQRVNIARALTMRPRLMVCDEVVAALDVSIQADILNLFADLQRDFGLTYVFITHDLGVVSHVSDRIAVMYLGRFMELGPAQDLAERPLHPYTRALLSSEPVPLPSSRRSNRRIILEGEIPSPVSPPSGCRFRNRCCHARDECASRVPEWREVAPRRWVACHLVERIAAGEM